jgi:hypothetical protein
MSIYKKAIKEILRFNEAFFDINPRVPSKLLGVLGEYYVLDKLEGFGYKDFVYKGGQSGYDILVNGRRVEVRTSLLKNDGNYPDVYFYGWKVQTKKQKKGKFDVLVCVALDKTFKKPKFYVFTSKEAFSVDDREIKRYPSLKKNIHLCESEKAYRAAIAAHLDFVTGFECYINEHPQEFENRWEKITVK